MAAKRSFFKTLLRWLFFLVIIAAVGWWYWQRPKPISAEQQSRIFAKVERGPLVINLTEAGSIKPREQIVIKSQVEGRNSILYIVPEGQRVSKGDILIELDSSTQQDKLVNQEITVQNSNASYTQAMENMEVVKNQAKADVDKAELALRFAKEDLIKYKDGDYPKTLNELESKVTLAAEELQRARDTLKWSKTLFEEKYLSETEYRSDELSCRRAELNLVTAQNNVSLLQEYTYKRQIAQLESDVAQSEMALERIRRSTRANIVQAEAQLRARELEQNRQRKRLEKIKDQIAKSTIVAPTDGLVIYATSAGNRWRGNTEPLQEGQEVFERQELIYLPTADTFNAEVKIHETYLKKIYVGLPVRVRIDALPGQIFMGKITKIAPLPDAQSMFMNPDLKVYNTIVELEGGDGVLKSGMNCEAEIIIEQHEDALYVPIQCVVRVGGKPVVYLKDGDDLERRDVEIGLDNNRMVHIISGLQEGEEVLITPPLQDAVSIRATDEIADIDIPTREQADAAEALKQAANSSRSRNGDGQAANVDRSKIREQMANMSEEERAEFIKKMRARRPQQNRDGEGGEGQPAAPRRRRPPSQDGAAPAPANPQP
ncbi:MAG: efflux RND transporter periplasmic adaptor subunit [Lentisphaeria bacterium]|jgi:HlyD family secretion protein